MLVFLSAGRVMIFRQGRFETSGLGVSPVAELLGNDGNIEVGARAERPLALSISAIEVRCREGRVRKSLQELLSDVGRKNCRIDDRDAMAGDRDELGPIADRADDFSLIAENRLTLSGKIGGLEVVPHLEVHWIGGQSAKTSRLFGSRNCQRSRSMM